MTKNKIITLVFVVLAIVSLALIYIFRIRKNNKLTYKYYDIKTNEEVFTSVLGGSNE